MKALNIFYSDTGPERVGFILHDGKVVELDNICSDPENGFEISAEDIIQYEKDIKATWHTHPDATSNLSVDDYKAFLNYPDLDHYIIGRGKNISCYYVSDGKIFKRENS